MCNFCTPFYSNTHKENERERMREKKHNTLKNPFDCNRYAYCAHRLCIIRHFIVIAVIFANNEQVPVSDYTLFIAHHILNQTHAEKGIPFLLWGVNMTESGILLYVFLRAHCATSNY